MPGVCPSSLLLHFFVMFAQYAVLGFDGPAAFWIAANKRFNVVFVEHWRWRDCALAHVISERLRYFRFGNIEGFF